jgi:hypothetical protein
MERRILGLLGVAAMVASMSAHAQLKSVDHGAAAIDRNGLMWANTVGIDVSWSGYPNPQIGPLDAPGSAQAWIAGLNATHYGGYSDWTLPTGDGSFQSNTTTNQLGELFNTDCGNSPGQFTALNNPGKKCTALSAVNTALRTDMIFMASSPYAGNAPTASAFNGNFDFWVYQDFSSSLQLWSDDTVFSPYGLGPLTGIGDALAVREVAAPEIDPTSAVSGLALLMGSLAVLRGRRNLM